MSEYEGSLQRDGRDLVAAARQGELPPVWGRDADAQALLAHVRRGRPTLLVGPAGVGKTSVVHLLAKAMGEEPQGRLYELSTTAVMAGTKYLGEWQSKITSIAHQAIAERATLYLTDIWNLPRTGRTAQSDSNLLDALRPLLGPGQLMLVGEVTPELLRAMERVQGFASLFQQLTVQPLGEDLVKEVIFSSAQRSGLSLDPGAGQSLTQLTTRFLPARPQPAPALELLRRVRDRVLASDPAQSVSPELIEQVFCDSTGLPDFVVSRRSTRSSRDLRQWFQERIVGQSEAIDAVVETIALFKAGLHDPQRPLGSFFFVGPTGVGKTELARCVATFLFGSPQRLLRFDLSEFKDYNSFEMLVGSPRDPDRPAALLDPVRAQPFQVVLLDELEKAHPNVWDLLLPLLDEGRLTPPGGQVVDFRNTIVIATSNVGALDSERSLGFGPRPDSASRRHDVQKALESHFRPELLNRFQHVVVFHPLSVEQVRQVARQELKRIMGREGITSRNLVVEVEDPALDLVIERGFDPRYGARALKREIQRQLVLPMALTLMEQEVTPGQILKVSERQGQLRVRLLDTEDSRSARAEAVPARTESGRKVTREELRKGVQAQRSRVETLGATLREPFLRQGRERLLKMRQDPDFWRDSQAAARALRDLDRVTVALDRLDNLRAWGEELGEALAQPLNRAQLEAQIPTAERYERNVVNAWRELVLIGWDGLWDALLEVAPVGGAKGQFARDHMVRVYSDWAQAQRCTVDWLRDPLSPDEPAMLAIKGPYAVGMLQHEAGLHRVRVDEMFSVARVRVAPWTDEVGSPRFKVNKALKVAGTHLDRLRSRVECEGGLVLQNDSTLNENRELAQELLASWAKAPAPSDEVVRRYDTAPPMLRDSLTGFSSGKPDALSPGSFHELLIARVDYVAQKAKEAKAAQDTQNR